MTEEEWKALVREAAAQGLPGAEEAVFKIALADAVAPESTFKVLMPAPSEPEPTIPEEDDMEVIDENTPEALGQRYIERHQGARAARGQRRRPTLRAWDNVDDLQYPDVGVAQPEKEGGPLAQGDGSVRVNAG